MQKSILWFRNDLRIADNEALFYAAKSQELLPVYCLDPREFGKSKFGLPRMGYFRAKFLLESLLGLKSNLMNIGSNLLILKESPITAIPRLAQEINAESVFFHNEYCSEETDIQNEVERNLRKQSIKVKKYWGGTLYHNQDIPFSIGNIPDIYTEFRKATEKSATVRKTFPLPNFLPSFPENVNATFDIKLEDLGIPKMEIHPNAVLDFKGGENEAMQRLEDYFFKTDSLKSYKETRNGLLGANYSSKFSPWMANGSISPRTIFEKVEQYEAERVKNQSTYWLFFELIWRDYFKFISLKYGNKLFLNSGLRGGKAVKNKFDEAKFKSWQEGRTGEPFVDANMRELLQTGFMSNRGRQNVASYLVKDLKQPWKAGAEHFEWLLIDYDPAANYGNWQYVAGVGNDPREDRYFNIRRQADMYDPHQNYVRNWLPELKEKNSSLF